MHVFLTGLTGFVGGHLVPELLRRGHTIRALVRDAARARASLQPLAAELPATQDIEFVPGDLRAGTPRKEALHGCDAVLHLAGLIAARGLAEFRAVNRDGTAQLLRAAQAQPQPPRFVLVSSLAAAGPSLPGRARREEDPPQPISWYGISKREGEIEAEACADNLPITILRPPAVYGPGDRATLEFFEMAARGRALFPGDPRIELSLIHVADLARGLIAALEASLPSGRSYYLTGAGTPSFEAVIQTIASALGTRARVQRVPHALAWCAGLASEWFARWQKRAPSFSRDKLKELRASGWACDGARAQRELGFQAAHDWRTGLAQTAEWYCDAGWLRRPPSR